MADIEIIDDITYRLTYTCNGMLYIALIYDCDEYEIQQWEEDGEGHLSFEELYDYIKNNDVVSFVKHDEEDLYKITIGHNPKIIVYWMHLH